MLLKEDKEQLQTLGISEEIVLDQVERFKEGFQSIDLDEPAQIESGIVRLSDEEKVRFIEIYDQADAEVIKFVPASGAATRMFKGLYQFLESKKVEKTEHLIQQFFERIKDFAFYDELSDLYQNQYGRDISQKPEISEKAKVIKLLLNKQGMNYGSLPKGLLKFHTYTAFSRTPVEEHIAEGLAYANKNGQVAIHFTVSPTHQQLFETHVNNVLENLDTTVAIRISYSTQKESTNTLAVDLFDDPFRNDDGTLLFRPAGHGALLENLNDLDSDIVFVKNIDNVVPDRLKEDTIEYKKVLAGVLLDYQRKVFELLEGIESGKSTTEEGKELLHNLGWKGSYSDKEVVELLDRPIRVCGMVKNEGEPGGGPFWVKTNNGVSLQIVESSQVDGNRADQQAIFESSTHFNPVDIVCGLKNFKGEKFDLLKYRDPELGFITQKTHQGRKLKAMELPGLWNGGMAHWNTLFVEVPLSTFNPVKTVLDLLKDSHC